MTIELLPEDFENATDYSDNNNCPLACALRRLNVEFSRISWYGTVILDSKVILQFNWNSKPDSIQHLNKNKEEHFNVNSLIKLCKEGFTFKSIVLESL